MQRLALVLGQTRPGWRGLIGSICGTASLNNPNRTELAPLVVSALANSGAVHLPILAQLAIQLSLAELERRELVLANGQHRTVPYPTPVEVRFRNRRCFTGAMVLGNAVRCCSCLLVEDVYTYEVLAPKLLRSRKQIMPTQDTNVQTNCKQHSHRRVPTPGVRGMKISSNDQRKIKAE